MKRPLKKLIDKSLDKLLPRASEEPKALHAAIRYSVFPGGKRIRPLITIETCRACGGKFKDAVAAASAVELVHTYSLIHDDLPSMDDDDYRRGKPSCHKAFGEANAILTGDALLTLAFSVIAENYGPKRCAHMIKELSEAIGTKGMVGGQALDVEMAGRKISKKKKTAINRLKTAKLFEVSAVLGAIAAGTSMAKINAAAKFGAYLGTAFQITDDIIDGENSFSVKDAEAAIEKSKKALKVFGKRADTLKKIADYILCRGGLNLPYNCG